MQEPQLPQAQEEVQVLDWLPQLPQLVFWVCPGLQTPWPEQVPQLPHWHCALHVRD